MKLSEFTEKPRTSVRGFRWINPVSSLRPLRLGGSQIRNPEAEIGYPFFALKAFMKATRASMAFWGTAL
jgi:hypothetical protein